MPMKSGLKNNFIMMAFIVTAIVVIMVAPLSEFWLDVTIGFNITMSLMVLLIAMSSKEPLEFSVFPSMLLIMTLFRLSLNISSTQSILSDAKAGTLIETFGSFVLGGNAPVGFVVFLIIVIVNFMVITKGAERVAEVAARFTLDAMPGKQMAIDNELNNGAISEVEAKKAREKIQREADFYGAMDGASKFVKGDAIAGLIITAINIVAGIIFGMINGLSISESLTTYTLLTVGDGLVSQIPALLIAVATGVIVTRPFANEDMGDEIIGQVFASKTILYIASGFVLLLNFMPGTNKLVFTGISIMLFILGRRIIEKKNVEDDVEVESVGEEEKDYSSYFAQDAISIEFGFGLVSMFKKESGGDFGERIELIRTQVLNNLGFLIPNVRVRDNVELDVYEYRVKINGLEAGRYSLHPDRFLAISVDGSSEVDGIETREPSHGFKAFWIDEDQKIVAKRKKLTVVGPSSVLATHFTEIIKSNIHELVTRESIQEMVENVRKNNPTIIEEVVPKVLSLGNIQQVISNLLRERVPIRNFNLILEAMSDNADRKGGLDKTVMLTEYARQRIRKQLVATYADESVLRCAVLSQEAEELLAAGMHEGYFRQQIVLNPEVKQKLMKSILAVSKKMLIKGYDAVIVCSPVIRHHFKLFLDEQVSYINVLSYDEISVPDIKVETMGVIASAESEAI